MLGDTIFAVASPPGAAARGILRLSGPAAFAVAAGVLTAPLARVRGVEEHAVTLWSFAVPCLVLSMPGPRSFTGEDVVELHLPGSPVLLDEVARRFAPAARLATPGEFTRRAYLNGRLDLAGAEAVLQLIHAADLEASRFAVDVLRGGLARVVELIRGQIQDALALLEAGLDFAEGETGALAPTVWVPALQAARARCVELIAGLPTAGVHGEILLLGAANAGKSSLANALLGRDAALVADAAGTTRDVLAFELADGLRLLDGPGDLDAPVGVDAEALRLRDELAQRVGAVLCVIDLTAPRPPQTDLRVLARVFTKADAVRPLEVAPIGADEVPQFVVSAATGAGLDALTAFLRDNVGGGQCGLSSRLHDVLRRVVEALDAALEGAVERRPEELVAVDLGDALERLDEIHGRSSPEHLLDRIFAGFCLGK